MHPAGGGCRIRLCGGDLSRGPGLSCSREIFRGPNAIPRVTIGPSNVSLENSQTLRLTPPVQLTAPPRSHPDRDFEPTVGACACKPPSGPSGSESHWPRARPKTQSSSIPRGSTGCPSAGRSAGPEPLTAQGTQVGRDRPADTGSRALPLRRAVQEQLDGVPPPREGEVVPLPVVGPLRPHHPVLTGLVLVVADDHQGPALSQQQFHLRVTRAAAVPQGQDVGRAAEIARVAGSVVQAGAGVRGGPSDNWSWSMRTASSSSATPARRPPSSWGWKRSRSTSPWAEPPRRPRRTASPTTGRRPRRGGTKTSYAWSRLPHGLDYDLGLTGFSSDELLRLLEPPVTEGLTDPDRPAGCNIRSPRSRDRHGRQSPAGIRLPCAASTARPGIAFAPSTSKPTVAQ